MLYIFFLWVINIIWHTLPAIFSTIYKNVSEIAILLPFSLCYVDSQNLKLSLVTQLNKFIEPPNYIKVLGLKMLLDMAFKKKKQTPNKNPFNIEY